MSESAKAVFLSYASQDAEAAKRVADALRAAGVEVWFDQNELVGGDAWDAKIRGQIGTCALFVPVISANTQARLEGYFRREWKQAASRTHDMADEKTFLLPVVIDDTKDAVAKVPAEFKAVQWTRLPGGETPASFVTRVQRLLTGPEASAESPRAAAPAPSVAAKRTNWKSLAFAALGIGIGLFYAARPWWQNVRPPAASPAASATPPTSTLTEAQKLVARARTILDQGDEMNRENYALAEELLRRAEAADVTEASAWSLHAWLSADLYRYGLDRTESRLAQIQAQSSRAASLAPDSLDAQLAVLRYQTAMRVDMEEIAQKQAVLAEQFPDDPRVYRLFGAYNARDSITFKMLERGLARWPDDPRLHGDKLNALLLAGSYAEAKEFAERVTRTKTGARALAAQVFIQLWWQGDPAAAAASVARWPSWFLTEDRGIGMAAQVALLNRTPEKALELLHRFPREYIHDSFFTGPRSALIAWAHEAAGQAESAEAEWRVVLQVCDRELAASPTDAAALHWKAWALARLGDKPAALQIFRLLLQRRVSIEGLPQVTGGLASLALLLDDPEEALRELGRLGSYDHARTRPPSRAIFDLNPRFDPLRQDPRFQALRASAPAPSLAQTTIAPEAGARDDKSVAVLAFANLSDDKANEYFSDGISEELLNVLAKVPGLKVSARTSSFFFKGKETPIPEIAQKLGVAYVVEGSVRKAGDKVRITAQLIKADGGFHVWSDTFTRDLKDVFAVQDEIAGLIAKNLSLKMGMTSASESLDAEVLPLYYAALQAWNLRTLEGMDRAEELLNRALALAPNFARGHAALAKVWAIRGELMDTLSPFGMRNGPLAQAIRQKVDQALALDPQCAEAYGALGVYNWDTWKTDEAAVALRRATQLNPNYASAHQWLGRVLSSQGYLDEGIASLQRAVEVDPLSQRILDNCGRLLYLADRPREALAMAERALVIQPSAIQAQALKAQALLALGQSEEALRLARSLPGNLAIVSAQKVQVLAATGHLDEVEQLLPQLTGANQLAKVGALCALGRKDVALASLDPNWFSANRADLLLFDHLLDPVRREPAFLRLLEQLGLVAAHERAQAWRAAHPPEKMSAKK